MHPTAHLSLPDLAYEPDGHVTSAQFGDVYFSRRGGREETEYVFLGGNGLPEGWAECAAYRIGEIGFGTGLNFLVTLQHFLATSPATAHLHYLAVEQFPLSRPQWEQALAAFPDLQALFPADAWPARLPSWHRIHLPRCTLTLGFGDGATLLAALPPTPIDAWYLDGFSPAKNPALWSEPLFAALARHSHAATRLATFTAAGFVKRGLEAQGFAMHKRAGFAGKREMLVGQRAPSPSMEKNSSPLGGEPNPPWDLVGGHCVTANVWVQAIPCTKHMPQRSCPSTLIVGAGIAGATLARALAERGGAVTVLEAWEVANAGSGNPAGVLFPHITKFYIPTTAWHFTAYALTLRQLARWKAEGLNVAMQQIGMLRTHRIEGTFDSLHMDPAIAHRISKAEAEALAGTELNGEAIYFPHGTWLSPRDLCRALLQHSHIMLHCSNAAHGIAKTPHGWRVTMADGSIHEAENLVLCNAAAAQQFLPDCQLPMVVTAGQITCLPLAAATTSLRCILSHQGYTIPTTDQLLLGATYNREDLSGAVTQAGHAENLRHTREGLPQWLHPDWTDTHPDLTGRTAFRATTYDRMPYVGQVEKGLWAHTGFGSRGLISAPLAAEIIASALCGEASPVAPDLLAAIHPLRRSGMAVRR